MWESCGRDRRRFQHELRCQTGSDSDKNINVAIKKMLSVGPLVELRVQESSFRDGKHNAAEGRRRSPPFMKK